MEESRKRRIFYLYLKSLLWVRHCVLMMSLLSLNLFTEESSKIPCKIKTIGSKPTPVKFKMMSDRLHLNESNAKLFKIGNTLRLSDNKRNLPHCKKGHCEPSSFGSLPSFKKENVAALKERFS